MVVLTPREQSVLFLISRGCPNKRIAHELKIQLRTVEGYVSALMRDLVVQNRVQLARWAWINEAKVFQGLPADLGLPVD